MGEQRKALEARAKAAVKQLEVDILDRRGLQWEWSGIDSDVKRAIRRTWTRIIVNSFADDEAGKP